jgi:hypothetical protein
MAEYSEYLGLSFKVYCLSSRMIENDRCSFTTSHIHM